MQSCPMHLQAPPEDALHRRHARVVPAAHHPLFDKPRELSLGKHGVNERQAAGGGAGACLCEQGGLLFNLIQAIKK